MRLFLYYASHTFKNQLKKIFKSWVVIFVLACALLGGIIGFTAARIGSAIRDRAEETAIEESDQEIISDEEAADGSASDTIEDGKSEMEVKEPIIMFGFELPKGSKMGFVELAIGAVILLILVLEVLSADKSGAKIFLPADVTILFPSPMKPQAVLMFRLVTKMGALALVSLYMLFQMPNLTMNLGFSIQGALSLVFAWGLLLILSMLLQSFLYAFLATHEGKKSRITTGVYIFLGVIFAGYLGYFFMNGGNALTAAFGYFNSPVSRYIPVIGWLKAFCMYAIEGNAPMSFLMLGLVLLSEAGLLILISRMKTDFYEDAMAKSEETAELLREAQETGKVTMHRRRKDRSEKLKRDGLERGAGANVFFWKTVYNRHRFAMLGYFTKTTITYFVLGTGAAVLLLFVLKDLGDMRFTAAALLLAAVAFYRSIGNPLDQDVRMDWFRMIPENMFKKLIFSFLGGSYNSLLDLLPGLFAAALILKAPLYLVPVWLLFILSVDAYSTTIATFIDLSIPQYTGRVVKQLAQFMFLYFGLGPIAGIIAVTWALGVLPVGLAVGTVFNLGLAALFICLSSVQLSHGR